MKKILAIFAFTAFFVGCATTDLGTHDPAAHNKGTAIFHITGIGGNPVTVTSFDNQAVNWESDALVRIPAGTYLIKYSVHGSNRMAAQSSAWVNKQRSYTYQRWISDREEMVNFENGKTYKFSNWGKGIVEE